MFLIIVAQQGLNQAEAIMMFILFFIVFIVFLFQSMLGPKQYDVNIRNGLPYCRNCNRQVSYRRDYCRSCGQNFIYYGEKVSAQPRIPTVTASNRQDQLRKEQEEFQEAQRLAEEKKQLRDERRAEEERLRKAQSDNYYLLRGVEPGPFAWFYVLPDWTQATIIGFCIATPIVFIFFLLVKS
jgi:hypothetical protein